MTDLVTLSSKNQFTLPVGFVRHLGLKKGSKLWTRLENKSIVIEPVEDSWDSLQGSLKDTELTKGKSVLEIIELARKLEGKRLAQKYAK
jgi:bifunctional DNA-binding transcriptional regulator/antitoxin component of YhaV-PrlF toxin-antitoxin module